MKPKTVKVVRRSQGRVRIKNLRSLFSAYFNNRMMMLLFLIEHPAIARDQLSIEKQKAFLHDPYHHFLPQDSPAKYHRAFAWLRLFLDHWEEARPRRIYRAIHMVGLVYEAFGMKLEPRMEAKRIEREMI